MGYLCCILLVLVPHLMFSEANDPVANTCSPLCMEDDILESECARRHGCYRIIDDPVLFEKCWSPCWTSAENCFRLCASNFDNILKHCFEQCTPTSNTSCIAQCFNNMFLNIKQTNSDSATGPFHHLPIDTDENASNDTTTDEWSISKLQTILFGDKIITRQPKLRQGDNQNPSSKLNPPGKAEYVRPAELVESIYVMTTMRKHIWANLVRQIIVNKQRYHLRDSPQV